MEIARRNGIGLGSRYFGVDRRHRCHPVAYLLAVELRQNTRAVRSASIQSLIESLSDTAQANVDHEYLVPIMLKADAKPEGLTEEERVPAPLLVRLSQAGAAKRGGRTPRKSSILDSSRM
jgi:hypothetical protein